MNEIKKGVLPWNRPWEIPSLPTSGRTGKTYSGMNLLLLMILRGGGRYYTPKYIKEKGWHVIDKKERFPVIFSKVEEIEREERVVIYNPKTCKFEERIEEKKEIRRIFKAYSVYHELNIKEVREKYHNSPIAKQRIISAEEVIRNYIGHTDITLIEGREGRAYFNPVKKLVHIPPKGSFSCIEEYYQTIFHELVHSTLLYVERSYKNQQLPKEIEYSYEELVAEIGACMLMNLCNLTPRLKNSASYIKGWAERIEKDVKYPIYKVSNDAVRAVNYLLKFSKNKAKQKQTVKATV